MRSPVSLILRDTPDLAGLLAAAWRAVRHGLLQLGSSDGSRFGCSGRATGACPLVSGAEEAERAHQLVGLAGQFFGGGGHLFGRRSVLLDHLLQLLQRLVDLLGRRCPAPCWRR